MISVAICTRNRAPLLRNAAESLVRMEGVAEIDWELIVVDNGSSDDTESVASEYGARLPLRYVTEREVGLARARNRAVAEFRGDYLVWTDDDVRVGRGWLAAYAEAFRHWPEAAVFGGPIRAEFEGLPPGWLSRILPEVASAYAIRDFSSEVEELSLPKRLPYGANYAVRGDLQREHRYDTDLGFAPSRPHLRGEEVDVIRSLLESGHDGRWVPKAGVRHWIPQERQSWKYLWLYYVGQGQQRVLNGFAETGDLLFGRPRWLWRQIVERPLRVTAAALTGDPERMGREFRECAVHWGMWLHGGRRRASP